MYNRVATFANFSITFVINMIETWFWCPYLCFRAWQIEWEQFWTHPINRVATFDITGLPDHLLTHKQVPQRWFLAWLNAAELVLIISVLFLRYDREMSSAYCLIPINNKYVFDDNLLFLFSCVFAPGIIWGVSLCHKLCGCREAPSSALCISCDKLLRSSAGISNKCCRND